MEDVLGIYQLPYSKEVPVICMDEKPLQLLGEIRERISASPIHLSPTHSFPNRDAVRRLILNMSAAELQAFLCLQSPWENGVMCLLFLDAPKVIMLG